MTFMLFKFSFFLEVLTQCNFQLLYSWFSTICYVLHTFAKCSLRLKFLCSWIILNCSVFEDFECKNQSIFYQFEICVIKAFEKQRI